jgi:alkylation response protein AidB-like acyl-CoA dehydrogenase
MPFDLALDASQEAVADLFGRFFATECPPDVVRASEPLGFSPTLWEQLRALGAPGIGAPEDAGGGGAAMVDLALVAEAVGASVAPVPIVEHMVAARAYPEPAIVDGTELAALALHPARDGTWAMVSGGAVAHVVVGLDGDDLVAVHAEPPGVALPNHADAPVADRATAGRRVQLGSGSDFERILTEWRVLLAASLAGLGRRALQLGTDYAKERIQFGRPIGGFQAVQHGLADCVPLVEGAALLARKAAWAVDEGRHGALDWAENDVHDPAALATMAFSFASEAAALTTKRSLQYHGSYGFSREYDVQLYYRRARGWPLLLDSPARERAALADLLWPRKVG